MSIATETRPATRETWLEERKSGLGASDGPSVLGINPFKSTYQLWAEKAGLAEPDDLSGNEAVEFGLRLEKPVAEAFAERTGREVEMWPAFSIVRDPARPFITCTPDAIQQCPKRGEGLLQIKTTNAFNASDWADGPPLYYQVQVQQELFVTGFAWGTIAVLIGGQQLRYFDVERHDEFLVNYLPKLEEFWQMVLDKVPPPVDGSAATAKVLAKLHPEDNGQVAYLGKEACDWLDELEESKRLKKEAEAAEKLASNQLKAAIGDATFAALPDGRYLSWKTQSNKGYVVEPFTSRVMRIHATKPKSL